MAHDVELAMASIDSQSSSTANEMDTQPGTLQQTSQTNRAAFTHFIESTIQDETTTIELEQQQVSPDVSVRIIEQAREYQQELFEKAKEENLIAVLDTGSGKTLIACLLTRHILAEELMNRSKGRAAKVVIFMANSVHLVRQQAHVLANNVIIDPVVLYGDYKTEAWKYKSYWQMLMEQNTPIVCTPAILQQCLDGAMLSIGQISLLIFDEAHHAKKNHPYSRIMRSHYMKCQRDQRPRIFGMTASPIDSKGQVDASVADLEELLDSKIITTTDMSIMSFAPKPQDVIWTYQRPKTPPTSEFVEQLRALCQFVDETRRGFVFAEYATRELGTWCAEQAWKYLFNISEGGNTDFVRRYEQSKTYASLTSTTERARRINNLETAYAKVRDRTFQPKWPDRVSLSPKVILLKNELSTRFAATSNMRAIVFVNQRLAALTLCDCFRTLDIANLRPGALLGSSGDRSNSPEHRDTMDHFRAGLVNLIFATSVADEGIDIPQCNLCIRFDLYTSPIQYMQSRGRARMSNSVYAHMIEEGNSSEQSAVQYVIDSEKYIKAFCKQLPPDRLLGRGTQFKRLMAQDAASRGFQTTSGAICDFGNCLMILSNFAASLQHIGAVEREAYHEYIDDELQQFRYNVMLPCSTETTVKGARGEWRQNKQLAKRSAAFNCCYILRGKGLLDESLRSKYHKVKPENLNALLAVSQKKSSYPMVIKPSLWSRDLGITPTALHATIVHLEPESKLRYHPAPIVLLTRHHLPELPKFFNFIEGNVRTSVTLRYLDCTLAITSDELEGLTRFVLDGVFLDIFNKQYENDSSKMSYWIAPANNNRDCQISTLGDLIDMQTVQAVQAGRTRWYPGCSVSGDWTNKFICDPRNGAYRYFSGNAANGVNAFDPVPDSVVHIAKKPRTSIIDFSASCWKASKKSFAAAQWDPSQPVLEAHLISSRRNFLEPSEEKQSMYTKCFIAPQPLEVSRLEPTFVVSCLVWPSIVHRLEAYMIALQGAEQVGLFGITPGLALEAFTKDTNADDLKNQTDHDGLHGMSKNYERLEFLGDSLLKMMTTITVFLRTNCDEEGMHCRRMEILCNRRLFDVSTKKHQLYRYIRTTGFSRDTWYPEHLILLKGRGVQSPPVPVIHGDISQDLSKKTIADVSEALMGAAAITAQYLPNRFDLGIKLITTLVDSPDHSIVAWSDIVSIYDPPTWSLPSNDIIANHLALQVKEITGYIFKRPRLLRSALTHSSDTNTTVPDLQRLEFLGDAVLDWVSVSWLFNTNPDRNPHWLTEHKMAMVSNRFLATLAVVLNFDKFISATSLQLLSDINTYAQKVRTLRADPQVLPDFWTEIDSPPKALSDLIESYLGAVLIDSGFEYTEIEKFFNKHILWFFSDIARYDGLASRHPTSYLHKKFSTEYKCLNFQIMSSEPNVGRIEHSTTVGVLVHGKVIAHAKAASARVGKVKACKSALALLEGMTREDFVLKFGCDCNAKKV